MAVIKIGIRIPKASDHEKFIEQKLKNPAIDKVDASISSSTGTIECTYDDKKHTKYRLEREVRATLEKLGYKFRY